MGIIKDFRDRSIRFTLEREEHIKCDHPEMVDQYDKIEEVLNGPLIIIKSKTDQSVNLYYKHYRKTPVTEKYLCVIVKTAGNDSFIITAFFTDSIKKGEAIWKKR